MAPQILFLHSAGPQGALEGSGPLLAFLRAGMEGAAGVVAPEMPQPEDPAWERWAPPARAALERMREGSTLVGHSLGGSVLLKLISEDPGLPRPGALLLVAVPFWGMPGWDFPEFRLGPGFAAALPSRLRISIHHAPDDPVVGFDHALRYAAELPAAALHPAPGCGHGFEAGDRSALLADLRGVAAGAAP